MPLTFQTISFQDLFTHKGLKKLDESFLDFLQSQDVDLYKQLQNYRKNIPIEKISDFILQLSLHLEIFLGNFFTIQNHLKEQRKSVSSSQDIASFKRYYLKKGNLKKASSCSFLPFRDLEEWCLSQVQKFFPHNTDKEWAIAQLGLKFLENPQAYKDEIEKLTQWCLQSLKDPSLNPEKRTWSLFSLQEKINYDTLVPCQTLSHKKSALEIELKPRDGFKLTDPGMSNRQIMNEIHKCLFCHKHNGDTCSKGFAREKNSLEFAVNTLGNTLVGCPLNIKISEMLHLKKSGNSLAALATLMIDNPLCPLTGYRICNDCMKSCVYQKLDPVHVPQIESRIFKDVLALPFGFEIYDLLTRWNPLRPRPWIMKPLNSHKVLVVGAGPSGIAMAYYLLQEGCTVVLIDGLKIEPLPDQLISHPIRTYEDIKEELDTRITWGFGGVAQYGITARWDKNFLKLVYISLARRQNFKAIGNMRFGGTLTVEEAWKEGFDHMVIAAGAGLPKELPIPGSLAPGMHQANDFLMALHLTGLANPNSLATYQVRLPAVIIGGGLTAIDTATEVQAYYVTQVEAFLSKHETLLAAGVSLNDFFTCEEQGIAKEFLAHGKAIRQERNQALQENRKPNFIPLLRKWGGVTLAYRKKLQDSPAYRLNHEEVYKALQEGIFYVENFIPQEVILDENSHVMGLRGLNQKEKTETSLPARSLFTATGTRPNMAYEYEHKGTFERTNETYQTYRLSNKKLETRPAPSHTKEKDIPFFTSYKKSGKHITFIGDTHPAFHGSVVKAIASAQQAYPQVLTGLGKTSPTTLTKIKKFFKALTLKTSQKIISCEALKDGSFRIIIQAPMAAQAFSPGQFFKFQLYETDPVIVKGQKLLPTALIAFPIDVDKTKGTLTFFFSEAEAETFPFALLKPGQTLALMGPTGARIKSPQKETILILSDASAQNIFKTLRPFLESHHNKVITEIQPHPKKNQEINTTFLIGAADYVMNMKPYSQGKSFTYVLGPMQCMLKGLCGQCLQWQIDPKTKKRTKAVFACSWQCQPTEIIDFNHLRERSQHNPVLEKMQEAWIKFHL